MKRKSYRQVEKVRDKFIEEYFTGTKYEQYYSGCGISKLFQMQSITRPRVKKEHLEDLCLSVLLRSKEPMEELPDKYMGVSVYYRVTGPIKALKPRKR